MTTLPSPQTPLNQHSLIAIESWLLTLGARKDDNNPCLWTLSISEYSAQIEMMQDELNVTWNFEGKESRFSFPYGLSRKDIEAALNQGP